MDRSPQNTPPTLKTPRSARVLFFETRTNVDRIAVLYHLANMAYSNSTSDRMDELRYRSQQSARNDSSLLGLVSPPRNGNGTRLPQPLHTQDGRGGLMRRFTTDSGRVPTIASITTQRGGQDSQDYGPSVSYSQPQLPPCHCTQQPNCSWN